MNINESKAIDAQQANGERAEELRAMPDGYYWAKEKPLQHEWEIIEVADDCGWIQCNGHGEFIPIWFLNRYFTFGPRIEPPD